MPGIALSVKSFTSMDSFNPVTQDRVWLDVLDHLDGHVDDGGQNSWDTCCGSGERQREGWKDVMAFRNN